MRLHIHFVCYVCVCARARVLAWSWVCMMPSRRPAGTKFGVKLLSHRMLGLGVLVKLRVSTGSFLGFVLTCI